MPGFVTKNKQLARITFLVIAQNPWHKVVRKISYLRESSSTDKGGKGWMRDAVTGRGSLQATLAQKQKREEACE